MAKKHYALEIWKEYTKDEDGFIGCSTEKRPLIKCDDCIHYESYGKHQEMGLGLCIQLPMRPRIVSKDEFCSRARHKSRPQPEEPIAVTEEALQELNRITAEEAERKEADE